MASLDVLKLSEVFSSVQGEGPSAGEPALFVRLALCNLRCSYCDTRYTWDFNQYDYASEVSTVPVSELLSRIAQSTERRLIVTGGEPLMQQAALASLLAGLPSDWYVEVETNGTFAPSPALKARINQWNVSPKLAHADEPFERRIKAAILREFLATERAYLKLVVRDARDETEAEELMVMLGWPERRVFLMPEARSVESHRERGEPVAEMARRLSVRYSPRLHVLMFGGERGR